MDRVNIVGKVTDCTGAARIAQEATKAICGDWTVNRADINDDAKRLGAGVEGALGQAKGYVQALGTPRDIVVTDGVRYRLYAAAQDFAPAAYANLVRLKEPALDLFNRLKRP